MSEKINLVHPTRRAEENEALQRALTISSNRNGEYHLRETDRKNGYYFLFEGLEVPFRVLIDDNNKTKGIAGIGFGSAHNCPSQALGLCQLPSDTLCYARVGEKRATKRDNEQGDKGMDSFYKGELWGAFWDAFALSETLRYDFADWLRSKGIKTLRFNLKSDFRHDIDILCIYWLACEGFKLTGYTARDDLKLCETLGNCENIILNGSNRKYTNWFKATDSIEEYLRAKNKCLGECGKCGNCYRLRGETITVLIHGNGSDTVLNNEANQEFILNWSHNGALGLDWLRDTDFKACKGFMACINKELKKIGLLWRPKTIKQLLNEVEARGKY